MKSTVDMILRKYGTEITLHREQGTVTVRGFFQPVSSTSWQSVGHTVSPLGHNNRAEYLCILPSEDGLQEGDTLQVLQQSYLVQRSESYCFGDRVAYQWALCVEKGVQEAWGK